MGGLSPSQLGECFSSDMADFVVDAATEAFLKSDDLSSAQKAELLGRLGAGSLNFAILTHLENSGVEGGSATANTWNNRKLNTIDGNNYSDWLTPQGDDYQFTLESGRYFHFFSSMAYAVQHHLSGVMRGLTVELFGNPRYGITSGGHNECSAGCGIIEFDATGLNAIHQIKHRTQIGRSNNGLGNDNQISQKNVYAHWFILKLD